MTVLLLALLVAPAHAGMKVDGKPRVSFFAVGNPGFLDIEGESRDLACVDDGTTLTFSHAVDTLTTGIGLRDEHMKSKFLHTVQYPAVTLSLPKSAVTWPTEVGQSSSGTVPATFTAHGAAQPTDVSYTVRKSKTGWKVIAKFPFDISKHGIDVPSYLGVTVETAMRAEVTFDLADVP